MDKNKTTESINIDDLNNEENYDLNNRNYEKKLTYPWVFDNVCQLNVIKARFYLE